MVQNSTSEFLHKLNLKILFSSRGNNRKHFCNDEILIFTHPRKRKHGNWFSGTGWVMKTKQDGKPTQRGCVYRENHELVFRTNGPKVTTAGKACFYFDVLDDLKKNANFKGIQKSAEMPFL